MFRRENKTKKKDSASKSPGNRKTKATTSKSPRRTKTNTSTGSPSDFKNAIAEIKKRIEEVREKGLEALDCNSTKEWNPDVEAEDGIHLLEVWKGVKRQKKLPVSFVGEPEKIAIAGVRAAKIACTRISGIRKHTQNAKEFCGVVRGSWGSKRYFFQRCAIPRTFYETLYSPYELLGTRHAIRYLW